MQKKLKLDRPLVFENKLPFYNLATLGLIFLGVPLLPLLLIPDLTGAVVAGILALIFVPLGIYIWNSVAAVLTMDRDGIESKSPLKTKRLPWGEVSSRSQMTFRGTTTYYVHGNNKQKLSFGEAIVNIPYALTIIDTVLDGTADSSGWLTVPPPPAVTVFPGGPLISTFVFAVMFLGGGGAVAFANYENYDNIFNIPTIAAPEAKKYADKPQTVRLRGPLHADQPAVSRDEKNTYALQIALLTYGPSRDEKVLDVWAPGLAWIGTDSDRVKITMNDPLPDFLDQVKSGSVDKNWKTADLANSISTSFDEDIDKVVKKEGDASLVLYAIPQDTVVLAVGKVVQSGDHLLLRPPSERTWIGTQSLDQMKSTVTKYMLAAIAAMFWGLIGIVSAAFDIANYKRKGQISW